MTLYASPLVYALLWFTKASLLEGRLSAARLQRPALAARGAIGGWRASVRRAVRARRRGCKAPGVGMRVLSTDDTNAIVINRLGVPARHAGSRTDARGIKSCLLEQVRGQSLSSFSQIPGEAFAQLTWLEPRTHPESTTVVEDYPTLPSWTPRPWAVRRFTGQAMACVRCPCGGSRSERPMVPVDGGSASSIGQMEPGSYCTTTRWPRSAWWSRATAAIPTVIRVCRIEHFKVFH